MMEMSHRIFVLAITALLAARPLSAQNRIGAIGKTSASGLAASALSLSLIPDLRNPPLIVPAVPAPALDSSLKAPAGDALVLLPAERAALDATVSGVRRFAAVIQDHADAAELWPAFVDGAHLIQTNLGSLRFFHTANQEMRGPSEPPMTGRARLSELRRWTQDFKARVGAAPYPDSHKAVMGDMMRAWRIILKLSARYPDQHGYEDAQKGLVHIESVLRLAAPASEPSRPTNGLRQNAVDTFHYVRLLAQNYYWYSVTHIVNMWPSYKKRWDEAKAKGAANVSRPREFFAYMRVAATSGRFYVLGVEPIEDDAMVARFRKDLIKWYDAPGAVGPKELSAFDSFTARAKAYNLERRAPSNMRKHIRDALLKGSTLEPSKLAAFFDSLLVAEAARETADFQSKGGQKRILDAFKKELLDTLAEEPKGAKGRVRAAILLGSFATGSAGPKSDFDLEILTDGGNNSRSPAFIKRLTDRWIATGHHARNPVAVHEFPSTPSRGVVDRVHAGNYIVVSLDSELAARLQRRPGEYALQRMRVDSLRGKVNRAVQYGVIIASTYLGELKARFGPSSSGR